MSQFQRLYTERQKLAVGVAQLDGHNGTKLSASAAAAALMAGELVDADGRVPPPAATMPKSTAVDCKRRLKLRREGKVGQRAALDASSADAIRDELGRRLVAAADRLTSRVESRSKSPKNDLKTADLLTKAARAAAAVAVYLRTAEQRAAAPPPTNPEGKTPSAEASPASELDRIGAAIEAEQRAAARDAAA